MGSIDRRDSTPQLLNRLRMRQIALRRERRVQREVGLQLERRLIRIQVAGFE